MIRIRDRIMKDPEVARRAQRKTKWKLRQIKIKRFWFDWQQSQNQPTPQQFETAPPSNTDGGNKTSNETSKPLDENFLKAIGTQLVTEKILGPPLHVDLFDQWTDVLKEDLPAE